MPRSSQRGGCESCFSALVLVGLSVLLVYWDYEGFQRLEKGLDWEDWVQQVWGIGMKMTITVIWFSLPTLIAMVLCRFERAAEWLGRLLLLATGPNLLLWNLAGSSVGSISSADMCPRGEVCKGWVPALLCVLVWTFLYLLSFVSSYVGYKLFRAYRPTPVPVRISSPTQWEVAKDSSMKQLLISKNSDEVCTICLDSFKKKDCIQQLIPCKHQFHETCLRNWLAYSATCPVCRKTI